MRIQGEHMQKVTRCFIQGEHMQKEWRSYIEEFRGSEVVEDFYCKFIYGDCKV